MASPTNFEFPHGKPLDRSGWERAECNFRVASNKNTIDVTKAVNELAKTGNITEAAPVIFKALPDDILRYVFHEKETPSERKIRKSAAEPTKKPKKPSVDEVAKKMLKDDKKLKKGDPNKIGYKTDGQISKPLSKFNDQISGFDTMTFPGKLSDVIDIKIHGLHCLAEKIRSDKDRVELFTTLLKMRKAIDKMTFVNYMKASQKISINPSTIEKLDNIIAKTKVDLVKTAKTNKESLYFSQFDQYLPGGSVKLYDHQIRLIQSTKKMASEVYSFERVLFYDLQLKMRDLSAKKTNLMSYINQVSIVDGGLLMDRTKHIQIIINDIFNIKTEIAKVQASEEYQRASNQCICNIAPTGTGKSVAIAAAAIGYLRNRPGSFVLVSIGYGQQGIEATCMNLDSCRETDGYAVITVTNSRLKITPRFGCTKNCKIFIGTPDAVKAFIDKYPEGKLISPNYKDPMGQPLQNTRFTYLVVHDEITGTDQGPVDLSKGEYYNSSLTDFHEVIKRAPHFILLSATTPADAAKKFDIFKKFAQVEIIEDQKLTPLAIELFNSETGERLLPHTGIKTMKEVLELIRKLKTCPMTRRCYTVDVFIDLCDRLNYPISAWLNDIDNIKNIPAKLIEILEEMFSVVDIETPFMHNELPASKNVFGRIVNYDKKITFQLEAEFLFKMIKKLMEKKVSAIQGKNSLSPQQLDSIMSEDTGINGMHNTMCKIMEYSYANGTYDIACDFAKKFYDQCEIAIETQMEQNIKFNAKDVAEDVTEDVTEDVAEDMEADVPLSDGQIDAFAHKHPSSTYRVNYDDIVENFNFGGQLLVACKDPSKSARHMLTSFIDKCLSKLNDVPLDDSFDQERELSKFFQSIEDRKAQIAKQESSKKKMADGEAAKELEMMMRDDNNNDIAGLYRLPEFCCIGTPSNAQFVGSGLGIRNHSYSINVEKFDLIKSNFHKFAFLCGAGVYDPCNDDSNLIDVIFPAISNGDLAIAFVGFLGVFGFNTKICALLVLRCLAEMVTISTIIQAIGRLCRMGKTYFGLCFLPPGIDVNHAEYSNEIRNLRILSTKDLKLNNINRALHKKPEHVPKEAVYHEKLSPAEIDAIMKQINE